MSTKHLGYETWVWVELIGFDNTRPDFGVQAYLDNAGIVPDAASLFVFNPEFVHTHDGMGRDRVLPFDCSTYGGHPHSYERERQDWTKHQVKALVDELHGHGVEAWFSVMDIFAAQEWLADHPEVLHINRAGQRMNSVCALKRLRDGTWYEDFFAKQVGRVLADYGFDGFHQADGYCHPRLPLHEGDFSDDMVEQFVGTSGIELPDGMAEKSGDAPEVIAARADWIWRHLRAEWLGFYRERFARFVGKVADAVHAEGKRLVLNQALTRDPFQAMYRYGVDYARLKRAGIDGMVMEMVAPGVALGAEGGVEANPHYDFQAMLLTTNAHLGDLPLRCLNGVHDVNEQWDVLRHGPCRMEREIQCQSNLYWWRPDGVLERCSRGGVVCLADGLQRHEWEWLRKWWGLAFEETPVRPVGATMVWSEKALEAQLDDYLRTRRWTTHKLVYELMARGAPVFCAARVEDLGVVRGPIVVPNPHLFPTDELARVMAYEGGPIVAIGEKTKGMPAADVEFEDVYEPGQRWCGMYGVEGEYGKAIGGDGEEVVPDDLMAIEEPPFYMRELYFRKVSEAFVSDCARAIEDAAEAPVVLSRAEVIRVQAMEMADGRVRLIVGNDSFYYAITEIDMRRQIESVKVRGEFPGTDPAGQGTRFGVKVPGKGVVVVDVTTAESTPPG